MKQVVVGDRMSGQNAKRLGVAGIEHGIPNFFKPFDWVLGEAARHTSSVTNWTILRFPFLPTSVKDSPGSRWGRGMVWAILPGIQTGRKTSEVLRRTEGVRDYCSSLSEGGRPVAQRA